MNKLSVLYLESICAKFERYANKNIVDGHYNRALKFIKSLSFVRYKFFLGYKNDLIEDRIKDLALHIKKREFKDIGVEKTIVIVDEINADYIGLMAQYLDSLISGSYQILYIYEHKEHPTAVRTYLMQILQSYNKAQIKQIPSDINGLLKSQWIYNEICAYGSKKVLMHFGEWAIEACVACTALPKECVRYRINCADHCFWAGVSCIDYTFEFRHYGGNLTHHERGLERDHIIYMPFYPVMQDVSFAGFPKDAERKFIFFSGGAIYKIADDENTFFRLCKAILNECPDSVILYAGADADNSVLSSGIEEFGLQGRFIPIGYRKDILEVFKRCDVYINTYPVNGGLMCQYAAQCSKPILNFKNSRVEECIAQKDDCTFTSFTESDFIQEATKLYSNAEYRKKKGEMLHHTVISHNEFDNALLTYLSTGMSVYEIKWDENFSPNTIHENDAIVYANKKKAAFYYKLYQLLGTDFIRTMPGNFISLVIYGVKRQLKQIYKRK